jgi:hypothetical protein
MLVAHVKSSKKSTTILNANEYEIEHKIEHNIEHKILNPKHIK